MTFKLSDKIVDCRVSKAVWEVAAYSAFLGNTVTCKCSQTVESINVDCRLLSNICSFSVCHPILVPNVNLNVTEQSPTGPT